MDLAKENRRFGRIFFPENPTEQFDAWLTTRETEIFIEATIDSPRTEQWPLILGVFNGLDKVTFVNCFASGGMAVGAGGAYTKIRSSYYISGLHALTSSELVFNKVTLLSPALAEWIIEKRPIKELDDKTYQVPEYEEIVNINVDAFNVKIHSGHFTRFNLQELNVKKVCTVIIESDVLRKIDEFASIWRDLKKLILFLTNKNPEFGDIYLRKGDDEYDLINVKDVIRDDKFSQAITISFHHVRDCVQEIVKKWFAHEKLRSVADLVLEKSINTQMSSQGFFLNVCVALETFYDNFLEIDKEGIARRIKNRKAIEKVIEDDELRNWFKEESSYWKNPTLRERLYGYREVIEFIMGTTFNGKYDTETFIANIVKTRNDMAHSGEYLKRFNSYELFLVGKTIEYTIRLEILRLIGVDVKNTHRPLINEARRNISNLAYLNQYNQHFKESKS